MCSLDIVPQSGPKGKCCPGKAKKDLPFSTNRPLSMWEDSCPLRLAYGKPPLPEREASFRALHGLTGLFHVKHARLALSRERERVPALSGLPMASHLPQRGRRVFASCRGFAGLFHVKHARLALSRGRERVPALSGLPWASHLPQGGRQVSPSCRGVAGLFHVNHAWLALSCGWKRALVLSGLPMASHLPRGGGEFSRPAAGLLVCFT